uniref:Zinc finger LSD1-type domain-containing protein n=1 Tax=Dunaliella tertiolecta TaxID=3047 RepID=A0A7S3R2Y4_DUNTE
MTEKFFAMILRMRRTCIQCRALHSFLCLKVFTCMPPATCATQVPAYGHLVCGGCSIMLMYPTGAESVKCSVCHFVTGVDSVQQQQQQQEQQPPSEAPPPPPSSKEDGGSPSVGPNDAAPLQSFEEGLNAEGARAGAWDEAQQQEQQQQQQQPKEGTAHAGKQEAGADVSRQENSTTNEVPSLEASVKK